MCCLCVDVGFFFSISIVIFECKRLSSWWFLLIFSSWYSAGLLHSQKAVDIVLGAQVREEAVV